MGHFGGPKWSKMAQKWVIFGLQIYKESHVNWSKMAQKWLKKWSKNGSFWAIPRPWIHGSYPDSLCKCSWNRGRGLKIDIFWTVFFQKKQRFIGKRLLEKSLLTFFRFLNPFFKTGKSDILGVKSDPQVGRVWNRVPRISAILAYFDHFRGQKYIGPKPLF
jgi:hypothetical protein